MRAPAGAPLWTGVAATLAGALLVASVGPPPRVPALREVPSKPALGRPTAPIKPSAPVGLRLEVLEGGGPGERARVRLTATPWGPAGRLDLHLALPEGLEVLSGATAESGEARSGARSIEVEVAVPEQGRYELVGEARIRTEGRVWGRSVRLVLPEGSAHKPRPDLPRRRLPGGGEMIEVPGASF